MGRIRSVCFILVLCLICFICISTCQQYDLDRILSQEIERVRGHDIFRSLRTNGTIILPNRDGEISKKGQKLNVYYDEVCSHTGPEFEEYESTIQTRMYLPKEMLTHFGVFGIGDQAWATEHLVELRKVLNSDSAVRKGQMHVYDIVKDNFVSAAQHGFFHGLERVVYSHPDSLGAFHRTRTITAKTSSSLSDYHHKRVQGPNESLGCPLIGAYPLSLLFTNADSGETFLLDLMAVQAKQATNDSSSYRIDSPPLNFTTLSTANALFLQNNDWSLWGRSRPAENGGILGNRQNVNHTVETYEITTSSNEYECTKSYALEKCRTYSMTPRDSLCTEWAENCGVKTAIKLPSSVNGTTHMLHIPSKTYGGELKTDEDYQEMAIRIRSSGDSQVAAAVSSGVRLAQLGKSMELSESVFLPELESDQSALTFTVIVLVFLSEWVLSVTFPRTQFGAARFIERLTGIYQSLM